MQQKEGQEMKTELERHGYFFNDIWDLWFAPDGNGCGTIDEAFKHLQEKKGKK